MRKVFLESVCKFIALGKKIFSITFLAFILCLSVCIQADIYLDDDEHLIEIIQSGEFFNSVLHYRYGEERYPITIINNPQKSPLWDHFSEEPVFWTFALIASLPLDLSRHLEDLVSKMPLNYKEYYLDLRGLGNISQKSASTLRPVVITDSIHDVVTDSLIKEIFNSSEFVNKVFFYYLRNEYFRVRILHNPGKNTFHASKRKRLSPGAPMNIYTISWNDKYGILLDKEAPEELIDHLSKFTNSSWWDWFFNFTIANGTFVPYQEVDFHVTETVTTTYYIDSWFNFAEDFLL